MLAVATRTAAAREISVLEPKRTDIVGRGHSLLPHRLRQPLALAAAASDLAVAMLPLVRRVGFDGVSYFGVAPGRGEAGSLRLLWSSAGADWEARYAERGYESLDPRLYEARSLTPFLWDCARCTDRRRLRCFLDDARHVGICSGVVVSLRDARDARVVIAFDSALTPLTDARIEAILENLGEIMLLAVTLQDTVLGPRYSRRRRRRALTGRESDCLAFAAHGLTSSDIGGKLGITERTVNFHVGNAIRKLGALNRPEAIAKGIARGLVRIDF